MKKLIPIFNALVIILLISTSCSKRTKIVSMNSMRPAEITFPSYVERIVLLDRTKFDKNLLNTVEIILTGELPGEEKAAVQSALNAMREQLQASPRFDVVIASERYFGNSLTAAFPNQLNKDEVDLLCKKYNAQALVAFEIFDSDLIVTDGKRITKKKVKQGDQEVEIDVEEFYAEGVANLKMGIRLYDGTTGEIMDQQLSNRTNTWSASAQSRAEALAKLINKSAATSNLARQAGSNYAYKIAPQPIRISREFYKKSRKSPEVALGTRYADVNQWSEAIKVWESGLDFAKPKQAGYLTYNIAVANEVLGDLDLATRWAQDAYTRYGNKKARDYVSGLRARKSSEARAEEQMK